MEYTTYQDLLEYAGTKCDSFSLVWRSEFEFEKSAIKITEALKSYLISEVSTNKWPGTELMSGKALLRTYALNNKTLPLLKEVSEVYEWVAPKYPEDLAFYSKGKVVFSSVAHEGMAWFET